MANPNARNQAREGNRFSRDVWELSDEDMQEYTEYEAQLLSELDVKALSDLSIRRRALAEELLDLWPVIRAYRNLLWRKGIIKNEAKGEIHPFEAKLRQSKNSQRAIYKQLFPMDTDSSKDDSPEMLQAKAIADYLKQKQDD